MGVVPAALLVAACTVANPEYVPLVEGCVVGERTCVGSRPVECVPGGDGGTALRNALCPAAATCASGRCTAPSGAERCRRDFDCSAGAACTALVAPEGGVATFCAAAEGPLPGGAPCTDAHQCRSNLCVAAPTSHASTAHICFQACDKKEQCASSECQKYTVTVTGIQGTISGCGPL